MTLIEVISAFLVFWWSHVSRNTKIKTVNIKTNILRRIPVKTRMNKNLGAARML